MVHREVNCPGHGLDKTKGAYTNFRDTAGVAPNMITSIRNSLEAIPMPVNRSINDAFCSQRFHRGSRGIYIEKIWTLKKRSIGWW